jgi:hypothetical protein
MNLHLDNHLIRSLSTIVTSMYFPAVVFASAAPSFAALTAISNAFTTVLSGPPDDVLATSLFGMNKHLVQKAASVLA